MPVKINPEENFLQLKMYNESKDRYISEAKVNFSSQPTYLRKYSLLIRRIRQGWNEERHFLSVHVTPWWVTLDPRNSVV